MTVTNQGNVDAYGVEVTDYIPSGLTLSYTDWTLINRNAITSLGYLGAGASTSIDITFVVDEGFTGSITNYAEISNADDDTDPTNEGPTDEDSTPDDDESNDVGYNDKGISV